MRRRIRSAAPPLHRHTLVRLAVDGTLLALAYYLAFQLRFNNGPSGYYAHLRDRTVWWVLGGSLPVLVLARVYQRDRKSTRLNSSHANISYAVFCLKKKKKC